MSDDPPRGYDLHTHSTFSDGVLEPERLVQLARSAGLEGFALTDHDSTEGIGRARAASRGARLDVLVGCELSSETGAGPVHVLGYGFDPAEPGFAAARAGSLAQRAHRAELMVQRLRGLGVDVSVERVRQLAGPGTVGRPHVAQAMVEAGAVPSIADAFGPQWLGYGGRAYVPKPSVSPPEAVRLIRGAGGAAVLAHPGLFRPGTETPVEVVRAMATAGLDGIEADHPEHSLEQRARWRSVAAELGLEVTAGSDFHGSAHGGRLGTFRSPAEVVHRLLARRPAAAPRDASRNAARPDHSGTASASPDPGLPARGRG